MEMHVAFAWGNLTGGGGAGDVAPYVKVISLLLEMRDPSVVKVASFVVSVWLHVPLAATFIGTVATMVPEDPKAVTVCCV